MKKSVFYILLITLSPGWVGFDVFAQTPTQQWVARYNRPSGSSGIPNQMALDRVGNCYVLGNLPVISGYGGLLLIKYNSIGDTLYTKTYNIGAGNATINVGVVSDSAGNAYVTGIIGIGSFGPYDVVTIKYDAQGLQQWLKIYDTGINDEPRDIAMDIQGNVYICGISGNQSLIIKYNPAGDTLWTRKYTEPGFRFSSITITLDSRNNVYIGGGKINISIGSQNYYTVKYDSSGQFKWVASYSLVGIANLTKVKVDNSYNVFVTGRSINGKILTIKYDSTGAEKWQRIYDGTGSGTDRGTDLAIDKLGNIIVAGTSTEAGTATDYVTIKYNTSGDSLWVKRHNGTANDGDELNSMVLDDSDNVYVTGRSLNTGTNYDYVTVKYTAMGMVSWIMTYNNTLVNSEDIAYKTLADMDRNIYVTGISDRGGVIFDYVTLKYSQPVGIVSLSNNVPNQYKLFQNYPNPFNPATKIRFSLPLPSKGGMQMTKLIVYDILGRELTTIVNEQLGAGTYEVSFDSSHFSSGIYFYGLIVNGVIIHTKKMILIR